ncbi:phosphotransferase [Rhizobium rhizosphaerae]|uniref:Phosphotransferase n=1 Tax=Xaviernesmea rhizosphaerae TaxID=1672749 RepID=A0ABX3PGB1_9HYPH|nr:CehA/McbA family metallohydrolase [Xaviernesmea rhizosphaerae]OQP87478.1 phosphotransferase [Xaviernesmea rhizosphaerae]
MLDAFSARGQFYKGNIHGHSTRSDGLKTPEQVAAYYQSAGYDFIAITDHFREKYGYPIVDTTPLRNGGFTTLIGAELHAPALANGELWHIVALGLPFDFAPPAADETGAELAARAVRAGAFVQIPHPEWYGLTVEDAETIAGAHAVEVYNHGCAVDSARGGGSELIDQLLARGNRIGIVASDDSHFWFDWFDEGCGGWVMVKAEENTPDSVLAALKAGHYYASQGPVIDHIERRGNMLHIESSDIFAAVLVGPASLAARKLGPSMSAIDLPLDQFEGKWCRLVLRDSRGRNAWTNPLWLDR